MSLAPAPKNPMPHDPLPATWPKYGTLNGKQILLEEARRTLAPDTLAMVVVDIPGVGPTCPWKGSDYAVAPDGSIVL